MAELDISPAAVLGFLRERGGRVRNTELLSAFRPLLEAGGDAAARTERRERFKAAVNAVAVVKERDGTKFVVLRRELRPAPPPGGDGGGAGPGPDPDPELIPDPEPIPDPDPIPDLIPDPDPIPVPDPDPIPELIPDPTLDPIPELIPDPTPEPIPAPVPTGRLSPPPPRELPSPRAVAELRGLFQGGGGGVPLPTGTAGSRREPQAKPCMLPVRCVPPPAAVPAVGPPEEPGSPLSPPQLEEEAGSRSPGLRRVPKNHRSSEEVAVVSLEETEHRWLVMVSGGQWTQQLHGLLLSDASLAARRDFISGFTALHWAAKSGNCDMMKNIITEAEKGGVRVNVDARSYSGYTALHLAAIHGQEKIITMLVYSYHAKIDLRDYSGKKPHQYLKEGTSSAVRRLLGDPSLAHSTEPTVPIKKSTKLAASILSSTSTFLGVISDDMAFYDLTKGLRKPSSLSKLLAATTGPRRKPKTRGGFPSYSSLSEVTEEEEEEVVVKRRPVSELFFGH